MKPISLVAMMILTALLSSGCEGDSGREAGVGDLTMTLATTSPLDVEYRLRDAVFLISGPET